MIKNGIWIMYLRKSRQDDPNESITEVLLKHENQLQEWAERELGHRISPAEIYREVMSGESIQERTEVQKVLARLEDPAVIGCLVMEPSRLSRGSLSDCAKIIDSFLYSKSLIATPVILNIQNPSCGVDGLPLVKMAHTSELYHHTDSKKSKSGS